MKAWKSDPACEAKRSKNEKKKKHGQSSKILCSSYFSHHPPFSSIMLTI
jgi:hypothetical protein